MSAKRVGYVAVAALTALGLARAVAFRFQEKENAIRQANQEEMKKLGLTQAAAKAKYPTPEIGLVSSACLLPGGTDDVVVKGKFVPGTKFIFQNDSLEVVKESLTGGEYRATLKAAAGIGPQTAAVVAISPVSGITTRHDRAAVVGGKYEWTMEAANGWKIVARSAGGQPCGGPGSADDPYQVLFYRKGEANPFETRAATLYSSIWEKTNHRFRISQEDPKIAGAAEDMRSLVQKMSDPKITAAQRDQLMRQIQKAQAGVMAEAKKMADPSYRKQLEASGQQFGCEMIELAAAGGALTGRMRCAQAVGTQIALTGAMRLMGK